MTAIAYIIISANCIICGSLFLRKYRQNSPFQVLYLILLPLCIFPGYWDIFAGTLQYHPFAPPIDLSARTIVDAHVKIFAVLAGFGLLEHVWRPAKIPKLTTSPPTKQRNNYIYLYLAFLASATIGATFIGPTDFSNISFDDIREGSIGKLSLLLFYFQILCIGLPAYYVLIRKNLILAATVFASFALLHLFLGGSRQVIVFSVAAVVLIHYTQNKRLNGAAFIILFTIAFGFLDSSLQILKLVRNTTGITDRINVITELLVYGYGSGEASADSSVRYIMYRFLTEPLPDDFGSLTYLGRAALFWLPSTIDVFGIKPVDFEYAMFSHAMNGRIGTMHPTLFGSVFADAQWMMVFWIIFLGIWMRLLEMQLASVKHQERFMLWATCLYFSAMIARGSLYAPLVITGLAAGYAYFSSRRNFRRAHHREPTTENPFRTA